MAFSSDDDEAYSSDYTSDDGGYMRTVYNGDYNVTHDLSALFSSDQRDFLIRNNGDQVKISALKGKILGIYCTSSNSDSDFYYTSKLVEIYEEVAATKDDFEVVYMSFDEEEEQFDRFFAKMPWLAVPFSEAEHIKKRMVRWFMVGVTVVVIIGANGKLQTEEGTRLMLHDYGADAYPFTIERFKILKEQDEAARMNQSLTSLLVSSTRDYLLSNNGNQIPVSELVGKTVGLYFAVNTRFHVECLDFTSVLADIYNQLKKKGEEFEVVFVSLDQEVEDFKRAFKTMPWLALPYKDKISWEKLHNLLELQCEIPRLIIIGPDGKTLNKNVVELIEEHGIDAYPFTPEKLDELEKTKQEPLTMESLLVYGGKDFLIEESGSKVPVSELAGKDILLYFSCNNDIRFRPKLIEEYHEIKRKYNNAFEMIFVSLDGSPSYPEGQHCFDECFSGMPWLALPFDDIVRKKRLIHWFKVQTTPTAIVISSSGRIVTKEAIWLISAHGADAYPSMLSS